jgi:hypothetical protein
MDLYRALFRVTINSNLCRNNAADAHQVYKSGVDL